MMAAVFESAGITHWALTKSLGMGELRLVAFCRLDTWVSLRNTAWVQDHAYGIPNCLRCVCAHDQYVQAFDEARRMGGGVAESLHKHVFGPGTPLWRFE